MPIKDLRSNVKLTKILNTESETGTTVNSSVYDSGEDQSVMFIFTAIDVDATATLTISLIQEDDNVGFSSPTTVASDKIMGDLTSSLTAANQETKVISVGVFSTQRFLRVVIDNDTPGTGSDFIVVAATNPNTLPAVEPDA